MRLANFGLMRTGKLAISRGHHWAEPAEARPAPLAIVPPAAEPVVDIQLEVAEAASVGLPVHERLDALERLVRLAEQGAFTPEEFAAEKALILGRAPAEPAAAIAPRRPSLLGRLLGWKLIPLGLIAGLGLSWFAQPDETRRVFEEALRLFGA